MTIIRGSSREDKMNCAFRNPRAIGSLANYDFAFVALSEYGSGRNNSRFDGKYLRFRLSSASKARKSPSLSGICRHIPVTQLIGNSFALTRNCFRRTGILFEWTEIQTRQHSNLCATWTEGILSIKNGEITCPNRALLKRCEARRCESSLEHDLRPSRLDLVPLV